MKHDRLAVWCTDKGQHARTDLGSVRVDGEQLLPVTTRQAPAPWAAGSRLRGVVDSETLEVEAPPRMIKSAPEIRDDHGIQVKWRFTCTRCGRDVPLSGDSMRRLFDGIPDTPGRGFDISLIPTK